jgi:hypothetical protein
MTKITFNKSDWTGETATIDVHDNKFTFNGNDFELVNFITVKADNPKYDFHTVDFLCNGEPFGTAARLECDAEWEYDYSDLLRAHKDPAALCAIAAANLI